MCGIVGVFGHNLKIDLEDAADSIRHRGPDMQGTQYGINWGVAFKRLSIHDLSIKGMQPFRYDGVTVYMNGEVYNYIELKEDHKDEFVCKSGSDVEIIPFLYRKYGLSFLNKLNGMFAIIIIDEVKQTNYLVRDRFGIKPLYYHHCGGVLYFSSEVKAIKKLLKLEIDKINIHINFSSWFLPQPLTLYKNTFNVNPGSYIEYKDGDIREARWYNPSIPICNDSEEEIAVKFIDLLKSSISFRLRSDVPVGIFLSGGLDSTSIAYFAQKDINEKFYAFGAEIVDKEKFELNNTDVEIPVKLSKDLGINYKKVTVDFDFYNKNIVNIIRNYDEIFVNSGVLIFYALSKLAKDNGVSVIFTGVGGDEIFGGYPWQSYPRLIEKFFKLTYDKLPYSEFIYTNLIKVSTKLSEVYKIITDYKVWHAQSLSYTIFNFDFQFMREKMENRMRSYAKNYFDISSLHVKGDIYNISNYANVFTVLGGQNNLCDIATMKNSVENRSPLLDYRLVEYMMSIPDDMKIKYGQKGLFRKILKKYLPQYVTDAKKSGPTMPLNIWFYNKNILNDIKIFVGKNLNIINEYLSPEISYKIQNDSDWLFSSKNSLRLFSIISLIIWAKINVTNEIKDENITFEDLIKL